MPEPRHRSAMFIVFLVVAIDLLGFGIVLPLVPRLAKMYLGESSDTTKAVVIGLMYSLFSLMQFVFSPVWGRLSDRIGRKPILLLGLVGSVVFYGLFGFAASLPKELAVLAIGLLLLSRIGAGIAGASVSTAAAVIADCTTREKRAKGMALIGAAFGIGFTFGPLIAWAGYGVFEGAAWGPGAMASGISLIALLLALALFKETLPAGPKPPRHLFDIPRSIEILKNPLIGPLIFAYFLAICAFGNFEATLSLFTESAFGMKEEENYLVFAYIGFVLMVAQGGIYRPLAGRRTELYMMTLGVAFMLIGLGSLGAVAYTAYIVKGPTAMSLQPYFYIAVTVSVMGFAFVNPSISAMVSKRADPSQQGEVIGVNQSFASLARIIGPMIGSAVFFLHDSRVIPFVAASLLMLGVIGLLPRVRDAEKTVVEAPK